MSFVNKKIHEFDIFDIHIIVPTAVDAAISVCILFVRYTRGQFKDAAFLLGRDFDRKSINIQSPPKHTDVHSA